MFALSNPLKHSNFKISLIRKSSQFQSCGQLTNQPFKIMKTISTLATVILLLISTVSNSQTLQNFEGGPGSIYGNCWTYSSDINLTSIVDKGGPISGTESMITLPPVNDGAKDWIYTPFLDLSTKELRVKFKYALNTKLAGSAYRYIKLGLMDKAGVMTMIDSIYLDKTASLGTKTYDKLFTLSGAAAKRLYIEFSGNTGDGNSRLIFDDFYSSASYFYGATGCNRAPVAANDAYLGVLGTPISGNLLLNDSDPDNEIPYPSVVTTTTDGTLAISPNGTFNFTPSPTLVAGKTVVFTYRLNDNGYSPLVSNIATVTIDYSLAVLACKLNSFEGKVVNNNLALKWSVSNNQSLKHIVVEESVNGKDFTIATSVVATNKSGDEQYSFITRPAFSSNMTYRLKMVDNNNQLTYSKLVAIQPAASQSAINYVTAAANQDVNINFQSVNGEVVKFRVIDLAGNVLHVGTHRAVKGSNQIAVPVSARYMKGIYVVQLSDASDTYVSKFVKH